MEKELFVVTFVTNCKLYSNNFTTLQYLNDNSEVSPEVLHLQKYQLYKICCAYVYVGGRGGERRA